MQRNSNIFWAKPGGAPTNRANETTIKKSTNLPKTLVPDCPSQFWGVGTRMAASQPIIPNGQSCPAAKSATQMEPTNSISEQTNGALQSVSSNPSPNPKRQKTESLIRRPISELPARFRSIFPYVNFNHVQSLVYDTMLQSNKPIVVSAPTGSGKTGVFELAIVKVIMDSESRMIDMGAPKMIYLAPTKALCGERRDDWAKKFSPFNIQCVELTSDVTTAVNFKNLNKSSILLATPEKWDSITRSWSGHKSFVQSIRLLMVDEVHLVNDGSRGATLEAVISRMKTIRSLIWPTEQDNLRFVAVSATVSNVRDIAVWFSTPTSEADVYQVDPRERPVKLKTVVLGYSANLNVNEYSFDYLLNHKLPEIIKEHSNSKPTLVFCCTRRSASSAANVLVKEGKFDNCYSSEKRKLYLEISNQLKDKALQETARFGIAFHHAGLCASDRRIVENGFIDGSIMILCCTSTLALGVNLPAHLVVIKNTSYFDDGKFKPYSESSLVQMIGRAGRPQFDTEATAVIMTKSFCRDHIEKMLSGKLIVDSQLHKFLTEHLNSEIVLGTIDDDTIARKWIDATFLHVRLMKNPENYGLRKGSSVTVKENTIIAWCKTAIHQLLEQKMARRGKQGQLEATDAGRSMAKHYICLSTMTRIVNLMGTEKILDLLQVICSTQEVVGDVQLRNEDKPTLSAILNPRDESQKLRYSLGDKVLSKEKKALALIQATFGNLTISENTLLQESLRIVKNAVRVMSCLKDICLQNYNVKYNLLVNVLLLSQCFQARLWNDSIYVSKQLEKIGPVLSHNLANNGLTSFELLRRASPRNIEIFCNRLPPFGSNVQRTCFGLPQYDSKVSFRSIPNHQNEVQMLVEITMINGQDVRTQQSLPSTHECTIVVGSLRDDKLLLRQQFTDGLLLTRPDMTLCFGTDLAKTELPSNNDEIECCIMSDLYVGLNSKKVFRYQEPEDEF